MARHSAHPQAFQTQFSSRARQIRRTHLAKGALVGLGAGCLSAVLFNLTAVLWLHELARGPWRWWSLGALVVGALAGAAIAQRKRWSDDDVALFLDARLETDGTIAAALSPERSTRLMDAVTRAATQRLVIAPPVRPPLFNRAHWGIAALALGLVLLLFQKPITPAPTSSAPGTEAMMVSELQGLESLLALEQLDALDAEHQEKLRGIAEQARALQQKLRQGMEQRQAQSKIARLQDDVDALLGEISDAHNRPGLAAALEALEREATTRKAAEALGAGDLVRFDEEMRRLSQHAEQEARNAAKEALDQANNAARQHGAKALSSALEEQRRLFEQRERVQQLLQQLAEAMPSKLQRALDGAAGPELDPQTQQQLADALEKALEALTEEERKLLGENLQKAINEGQLDSSQTDAQQLQQLAERLKRGEGQEELGEMLKQLSKPSAAARMMQGLRKAEEGLRKAQRQARGMLPIPQASPQAGHRAGNRDADGTANGGPGRGPGAGKHDGNTQAVDAEELRALAEPQLNPNQPLLHAGQGRTQARAGEHALTPELEGLSAAGAEELQGVEHSTIPEEYREQVSRYFAP